LSNFEDSKRILGLFPSFGIGITGGIETSAEVAWEALTKHAHHHKQRPFLLCYGQVPNNAAKFPAVHYASTKHSALIKTLDPRLKPSMVFIWHLGLLKLIPAFLRHRPRIIVFLHGIEAWRKQDRLTSYLLNYVDLFLSNSTYTWNRFLEHQPQLVSRRNMVVPLGLGETLVKPISQPDERPKLFMLSRLSLKEDYKGHREIINAWPEVLMQLPNAQLIIAGEGDLRPALEHLVRTMKLEDSIEFLGYISEETKHILFSQCRAFAMPSRNEGFGLVYLEAMRMGRPCLVSIMDAGREVVNPPNAGLAVDVHDQVEVVNAICRLLTTGSEWEKWSISAKQRYNLLFTKEVFLSHLTTMIEQVI